MMDYSVLRNAKAEKKQHWREINEIRKAHIDSQNAANGTPTHVFVKPPPQPAPKEGLVQRKAAQAVTQTKLATPAPAGAATATSASIIVIPDNWKDLNWPDTRDLAQKIVGPNHELKSRAEARTIIAAHKT